MIGEVVVVVLVVDFLVASGEEIPRSHLSAIPISEEAGLAVGEVGVD